MSIADIPNRSISTTLAAAEPDDGVDSLAIKAIFDLADHLVFHSSSIYLGAHFKDQQNLANCCKHWKICFMRPLIDILQDNSHFILYMCICKLLEKTDGQIALTCQQVALALSSIVQMFQIIFSTIRNS